MIKFNIYRNNSSEQASDFDMGDIEFVVDEFVASSRNTPRFSNMIYITISDLIDGLVKLLSGEHKYELVAADSSFIVHFKSKNGTVVLIHKNNSSSEILLVDIANAVYNGVHTYLQDDLNILPIESAARSDFYQSLCSLKEILDRNGTLQKKNKNK